MGVGTVIVVIIGLSYLERLQVIWNATDVVKKYKSINYFKTKKIAQQIGPVLYSKFQKRKKEKYTQSPLKKMLTYFQLFTLNLIFVQCSRWFDMLSAK